MAKKRAPEFTYIWTVTFVFGWSMERQTTSEDITAYDLSQLLERWESYKRVHLRGVVNPVLVKVERGKSVYA